MDLCRRVRVKATGTQSGPTRATRIKVGRRHDRGSEGWALSREAFALEIMLPAPVSFRRRGGILNHSPRSFSKLLRAPARLTNLGALLLSSLLTFSLLLNFRFFHLDSPTIQNAAPLLRSIVDSLPERRPSASGLDHLVIVPGHAIWIGARWEDAEVEDSWLLASYQKGRRRPTVFRAHIARG